MRFFFVFLFLGNYASSNLEHRSADTTELTSENLISVETLKKIRAAENMFCLMGSTKKTHPLLEELLDIKTEDFPQFLHQLRQATLEEVSELQSKMRDQNKIVNQLLPTMSNLDIKSRVRQIGALISQDNSSLIFYPNPPTKDQKIKAQSFLNEFGPPHMAKDPEVFFRQSPNWNAPQSFYEYKLDSEKVKDGIKNFESIKSIIHRANNKISSLKNQIANKELLLREFNSNATLDSNGYLRLNTITLHLNQKEKIASIPESDSGSKNATGIQICNKETQKNVPSNLYYTITKEECEKGLENLHNIIDAFVKENGGKNTSLNFSQKQALTLAQENLEKTQTKITTHFNDSTKANELTTYLSNSAKKEIESLQKKITFSLNDTEELIRGMTHKDFEYLVKKGPNGYEFYPVITNKDHTYLQPNSIKFVKVERRPGAPIYLSSNPVLILDEKLLDPEGIKEHMKLNDNSVPNSDGSFYSGSSIGGFLFGKIIKDCSKLAN